MPQIFVVNVLSRIWFLFFLFERVYSCKLKVLLTIDIENRNSKGVTLSVEGVYLIVLRIVETLHREILIVRIDINYGLLSQLLRAQMIEKMVMLLLLVVEQIHKDKVISDETASNEWIRKVVNRHCVVVKT